MRVSVPAEQFALAQTFDVLPDAEFDAVRFVRHGTGHVAPLLWVSDETGNVGTALEADESTTQVRLVSRRNQDSLFRVRWSEGVSSLSTRLVADNGAVISAHAEDRRWRFRLLFPERADVSTTNDACSEFDITIEQIHPLDSTPSIDGFRLTDEQFTTVRAALERGYYTVPRETKLETLATELGVSHQALSERLRRGHRALVETLLTP